MTEPTNLEVFRGGKKEPCPYCGDDMHAGEWACPRIHLLVFDPDTGENTGIEFVAGWQPTVAGG